MYPSGPSKAKSWGKKWWGGPARSSGLSGVRCNLSNGKRGNVGQEKDCCFVFSGRHLKRMFLILLMWKTFNCQCSRLLFAPMVTSFSLPLNCRRQQQLLSGRPSLSPPDSCVGKRMKIPAWTTGTSASSSGQTPPQSQAWSWSQQRCFCRFWNCSWHERLQDRWGINLRRVVFLSLILQGGRCRLAVKFSEHYVCTPFNDSAQQRFS